MLTLCKVCKKIKNKFRPPKWKRTQESKPKLEGCISQIHNYIIIAILLQFGTWGPEGQGRSPEILSGPAIHGCNGGHSYAHYFLLI